MNAVVTLLLLVSVPLALKKIENTALVKVISPVALAYLAGILLSFLPFKLPIPLVQEVSGISIALSISLLVLDSHLDRFRTLLKPALKSFFLGIASLFIVTLIVWFTYGKKVAFGADIMGMLTGIYVGGTPNMNAIGLALGVPNETIVILNTADIVFGGIYFLLLLTVIKPFLSLFLRNYVPLGISFENKETDKIQPNLTIKIKNIALNFFWAGSALGLSFLFVSLLFDKMNVPFFLISLTTFSFLLAQWNPVKKTLLKFDTADYLLLVFSFGIGCQIDLEKFFSEGSGVYLLTVSVFLGTILLHYLLAYFTKTDVDTLIISSTAALYGPAFIAPIAKAIGNRELIIYGITLGLFGYILGNYLGLAVAGFLEYLL
ncbi:MAG: DUF819 family protein [Cyclobacteriaceae bacterium]|nr:DUF819 family protein [Cyclobacteriaceae bacterium]